MNAIATVAAAVDPALREYAVADPSGARYDGTGTDPFLAFVLEAVREGYEMHYGQPRAFAGMDDDLHLLAGDALYALGLARLAEQGDLTAVAELADLISACAQAHADGRPEQAEQHWKASSQKLARPG